MNSKTTQANLLLFLTAILWGGGFVAQRLGMQQIGPFIFNGFRFLIGGLTLLPVIIIRRKRGNQSSGNLKLTLLIGCGAGLLLFSGATFQQLGIVSTTAGKAGFITGLYVIIVPILGIFWGDKAPITTWLGALLAVVGLYLLSATKGIGILPGDGLVLIGAVFWALHVQFLSRFSPGIDPIQVSFVQSLLASLISFSVGIVRESFLITQIFSAALPILYGGVISIGIAHTLQVVAQRDTKPAHAAILLSLEAVFAVFWGWLIIGEILSARIIVGCILMLAGMVISQLRHE